MPDTMDVPMGHKRVKVSWYRGNVCSSTGLLAFSVESCTLHPKQRGQSCHCHEILWMFLDFLHVPVAQHFPSRCQFFFLFQKECLLWNFCDLYFLKCLTQMIKMCMEAFVMIESSFHFLWPEASQNGGLQFVGGCTALLTS